VLPVVTLRPPFVYGPANNLYREAFVWDHLHANRRIILPGDGRRLAQFIFVKDLVKVCVKVWMNPQPSATPSTTPTTTPRPLRCISAELRLPIHTEYRPA
jgi:nucleoside-diphosphate-sugar epimerase